MSTAQREDVHVPFDTEVHKHGLVLHHIGSVTVASPGVEEICMEPESVAAVGQGKELNAGAGHLHLRSGAHAEVGIAVGAVDIVGHLAKHFPLGRRGIGKLAHHRHVAQEESLAGSRTVHQVELKRDFTETEPVAERQIADVAVRGILQKVGRPDGLEKAVTAVPHEVVGIHVAVFRRVKGAFAELERKPVSRRRSETH